MITIGIPAYNEEKTIQRSIENIVSQNIKQEYEILVVTGGCTDNTDKIVRKLSKKYNQIKLLSGKKRTGKAAAMNRLVREAKGKIIIQTDADVLIEKNSIKKILKHFQDPKVGLVSGRPIPVIPESSVFYDWVRMSYEKMHKIRLKELRERKFWHVTGYLCGIRKSAYVNIPPDSIIDDAVFGLLVWKNNWKINYEPEARVHVKPPLSVVDFIKQKGRNRAGYYQIKKRYEKIPRSLAGEFKNYFLKEISRIKSWKQPLSFFPIGLVYLLSWIYGYWLIIRKADHIKIWRVIKTSK